MYQFDQDIILKPLDAFSFEANISPNWSFKGIPSGGYLMAILTNGMLRQSDKKGTPIITAKFMSRSVPGKAEVTVEPISRSKRFDHLQAKLSQEGKERVRAIGTFVGRSNDSTITRYEGGPPEISPLEQCVQISEIKDYSIFSHMDIRLDPDCAGWMSGNLTDKSQLTGWIKFRDDRPFDVISILLISDSFPAPALASQGKVAWVPTIEFSVSVRNVPRTEWLKCVYRTRFINCGVLEDDGQIWDEDGELIAISRQIGQFRKDVT